MTHKKEAEMAVKTVQFPHVARLCYTLEQCFTHGLKPFLFGKPTYWNWVQVRRQLTRPDLFLPPGVA